MKDELVHHGMAKKFYESKFPDSKLQIAFKRERYKNKLRLFYYKNLRILNKIFDPILNFLINSFGNVVKLISIPDTKEKNLMLTNSKSVVWELFFLGISAYYHDSSVALIDTSGSLIDFKKEEWLSRVKGDKSFPRQSLQELIETYQLSENNIFSITFYEKPVRGWITVLKHSVKINPISPLLKLLEGSNNKLKFSKKKLIE